MSLINNMLKDLDQRRKGADSESARVRLTPAADFSRREKSIKPSYIIAGLSFVVVALGFAWIQISNNDSARPEIQTQVPMSPLVAQAEESASPAAVATQADVIVVSEPTAIVEFAQNTTEAQEIEPQNILTQVVKNNEISQAQQVSEITPSVPRNAPAKPMTAEGLVLASGSKPRNNLDLTSGLGVDSSVKNDAVVSEDEQDTLAVQEALGLIAENQLAKAYEILATHIANNRYAHQSRETYAKLLVSAGEYQQAYNLLDEGLSLTPNHPGFKKVKARIWIQNGQVLDAVQMLLSRAPPVAEDLEYHEILASAQLATKDFAGASISYSGLVGENQREGKFWYGYAAAQELLGNTEVARQAYSQAVKQSSLSASLRRRSQDRLLALGL